jgi:hypothetical protein
MPLTYCSTVVSAHAQTIQMLSGFIGHSHQVDFRTKSGTYPTGRTVVQAA